MIIWTFVYILHFYYTKYIYFVVAFLIVRVSISHLILYFLYLITYYLWKAPLGNILNMYMYVSDHLHPCSGNFIDLFLP